MIEKWAKNQKWKFSAADDSKTAQWKPVKGSFNPRNLKVACPHRLYVLNFSKVGFFFKTETSIWLLIDFKTKSVSNKKCIKTKSVPRLQIDTAKIRSRLSILVLEKISLLKLWYSKGLAGHAMKSSHLDSRVVFIWSPTAWTTAWKIQSITKIFAKKLWGNISDFVCYILFMSFNVIVKRWLSLLKSTLKNISNPTHFVLSLRQGYGFYIETIWMDNNVSNKSISLEVLAIFLLVLRM